MNNPTHTPVELKPCPFCGSANVDAEGWASTDSKGPACDDCGASAGEVSADHADNITAWNTRTVDTELLEALKHVTNCLVEEMGNLANEDETDDEDLAAMLGADYARQVIAARLRIRQARAALQSREARHG